MKGFLLDNSTVSGNMASTGGGIFVTNEFVIIDLQASSTPEAALSMLDQGNGLSRITNSTIFDNTASELPNDGPLLSGSGGGGGVFTIPELRIGNTVIANNATESGSDQLADDVRGNLVEADFSLITSDTGATFTGISTLFGIDPLLGPLTDNGGPTQTHALLLDSPAINAGDPAFTAPPATDQRGELRVQQDRIDIGAFESNLVLAADGATLVVDEVSDVEDGFIGEFGLSLREAITLANISPGSQTIEFSPAVFDTPQTINLTAQLPTITEDLTVLGPGPDLLTLDAGLSLFPISADDSEATLASSLSTFRHFDVDDGDFGNEVEVTLSGLLLTGGSSPNNGGAIRNAENLSVLDSRLIGNFSTNGSGGAVLNLGTLEIANSTLSGNSAESGGAVFNASGTATFVNSTISGNTANSGGGIFNESDVAGGMLTIANSTLSDNSAFDYGGGVTNSNGDLTVANSTLSGNSAVAGGAGIANTSGSLAVANSTLTGNYSFFGFGGIYSNGTLTLTNSIVAGNDGGASVSYDLSGQGTVSGSFNLIGDGQSLGGLTNTIVGDPLLGPLANNGGPTETHAPLPGSPLIDAGDPLGSLQGTDSDQRGFARVADGGAGGGIDIGAVESQAAPVAAPGDFNRDGVVGLADFTLFRDNLGVTGLAPLSGADGDGDGAVTAVDFLVLQSHLGFSFTPPDSPAESAAASSLATDPIAILVEATSGPLARFAGVGSAIANAPASEEGYSRRLLVSPTLPVTETETPKLDLGVLDEAFSGGEIEEAIEASVDVVFDSLLSGL